MDALKPIKLIDSKNMFVKKNGDGNGVSNKPFVELQDRQLIADIFVL